MHRLLVRIAALALCASALSACGMFGGGSDDTPCRAAAGAQASRLRWPADLTAAPCTRPSSLRMKRRSRRRDAHPQPADAGGARRCARRRRIRQAAGAAGPLATTPSQFLNRAVELQPNDWTLYSALGVAYDQLKRSGQRQSSPMSTRLRAQARRAGDPEQLCHVAHAGGRRDDRSHALMQAQASGSTDPKIARNPRAARQRDRGQACAGRCGDCSGSGSRRHRARRRTRAGSGRDATVAPVATNVTTPASSSKPLRLSPALP